MISLRRRLVLALAGRLPRGVAQWQADPAPAQKRLLLNLLDRASDTVFGREHDFAAIRSVREYQARLPLRRYLDFKPYWDRMLGGEKSVTWPGHIRYIALTSGTTAGNKFIPLSDEGVRGNMMGGRMVMNLYLSETRDASIMEGKFLYLGGSTTLQELGHGRQAGDLSGIVTREMPLYARAIRLPSPPVAALTDWEQKLDAIARESFSADVRVIGGTPSWLVCLFERVLALQRAAGRPADALARVWPNLALLIHGGVSYEPYRATFHSLIGKPFHSLNTYAASEGFIAAQDALGRDDMLLLMNTGLFYEFVPAEELDRPGARRLTVADVEKDVNYAVVLTNNSGAWSYVLGDTVRFTTLRPHRLRVTGRTALFLNAFGEHVIVEESDQAVADACRRTGAEISDYHVAPRFPTAESRRPGHEWIIEFLRPPAEMARFAALVDEGLRRRNDDYAAHRQGDAGMNPPRVTPVPAGTFYRAMRAIGRFGAQNKAPRLKNDRAFADVLLKAVGGPRP